MATGDLDQDGKISFDEFIKVSNDTEFKAMHLKLELSVNKHPERRSVPSWLVGTVLTFVVSLTTA